MTKLLIGLRTGLFTFEVDGADPPVPLFRGIQPASVAADPSEPTRLYCATYDRGLWRSEDAAETWIPVGTPQQFLGPPVSGTIDPRETTFVSVSPTPERDGRHAVWVGTEPSRLYRSVDHGETFECASPLDLPSRPHWAFPPRPDSHHVQRIAHSADGRLHISIEAGAMLLSRDDGRTFADRLPDSPVDTHVLLTHELAPGRLYAALGDAMLTPGRSFAESHDNGESWEYSGRGLEATPYLYGLAINPADPDDIRIAASQDPKAAHANGGSSIFRRDGNGWIEDADGFPREHSLVPVLAADPGGWFALSDLGLFAKPHGTAAWTRLTAPSEWRGVHPITLTILPDRLNG